MVDNLLGYGLLLLFGIIGIISTGYLLGDFVSWYFNLKLYWYGKLLGVPILLGLLFELIETVEYIENKKK